MLHRKLQGKAAGMACRCVPVHGDRFACAKHASNPAGTSGIHRTTRAAAFCMHSSTWSHMR